MARMANKKFDTASTEVPPPEETKVFLSYSRKDAATLQRIADALITHPELQPDFDKAEHDPDKVGAGISADEPWWQRLEEMIAGAEAMVFLVSPHSAASKVCDEEIAYAQRLGKRIIPVLVGAIDFAKLPPKLSSLNIAIDFTDGGPGFDNAMALLIRVLSVNAAWLREGRRYAEDAADWHRKARPQGGLLPPGAFEEAEAWASRRPKNEPEPGELFTEWIAASRANIQDQIARERRQISEIAAQQEQIAAEQKKRGRQQVVAALSILVLLALAFTALWGGVQGFRQLHVARSEALMVAADIAMEEGVFDRALRLAVLSANGDWLRPGAAEAGPNLASLSSSSPFEVTLAGHSGPISSVAFLPDGSRIVTTSADNTARVWREAEDSSWDSTTLEGHEDMVTSAAFSPDGTRIVTASNDRTARVWREADDGSWDSTPLLGHEDYVSSAAFSRDGTRIVIASRDGTARVWREAEDGSWNSTTLVGHEGWVTSAAFSPDGARIVTASDDNTARVWHEEEDGVWLSTPLKGHLNQVFSAEFSNDGALIVTSSSDNTARVWHQQDEQSWESDILRGHIDYVRSARFSPDGMRIVTASGDYSMRIWDRVDDGVWQSTPIGGHSSIVRSASFSPDGTRLLSYSEDGTARIWRQADNGTWSSVLLGDYGSLVLSGSYSPDGNRIVTAGSDGKARVWSEPRLFGTMHSDDKAPEIDARSLCLVHLSRSSIEMIDENSGEIGRIYTDRIITAEDAVAYPGVRDLVGQDACASILNPPPWWHSLAFWR